MKGFPDLPPIWLVVFLALNWVIAQVIPGNPGSPFFDLFSWALIALGIFVIAWAAFCFWKRKTSIEPHHAPAELIVDGPYKMSRNPIYLAMVLILIGSIIANGQPLALILVPFFIFVLGRRFIAPEERALRRAFGERAEAYLKRTRRWV